MTAAIRRMRWWDIDPVMHIERDLFVDDAWSDTMFWSELAQRESRVYLVATAGDDVVGYAGLCAYGNDVAYVQTIAVGSAHQGTGIGTRLLQALLDEAERRGSVHVDLEVRADNSTAIGLYERYGFQRLGVRRGYYQPSGADALVMRRSRQ